SQHERAPYPTSRQLPLAALRLAGSRRWRRTAPAMAPRRCTGSQTAPLWLLRTIRNSRPNPRLPIAGQDSADEPCDHRSFQSWPNRHHSTLMFANFITLAHFSVSSTIRFPNSAGVIDSGSTPKPIRRAFMAGSQKNALVSLINFSTIVEDLRPRP